MIITYLRSSSYSKFDFCQQSYFLNYVLGIREKSNKAAELGTIVHKVMECLAICKKLEQEGKPIQFKDEAIGEVEQSDIRDPAFVMNLLRLSYKYYSERSHNVFTEKYDWSKCKKWTLQAITELNGAFDPRNRNVVSPELPFDFVIEEDWAKFNYDGVEGYLGVKGTIDLVCEDSPGVYESLDWKTGARKDWGSGAEKDYDYLCTDSQLSIYHYALSRAYPDVKYFIPTIYYIRDGGAFTIPFGQAHVEYTTSILKKRFNQIRDVKRPHLNKSWKCSKFCFFGMNPHKSGEINPRTGFPYTICEYIAKETRNKGMDAVIAQHTEPGFSVGYYQSPGA